MARSDTLGTWRPASSRTASRTPEAFRQIRKAVIQAKWDLSERDETEIVSSRLAWPEYAASPAPNSRR